MDPQDLIAEARAQHRRALDERAGKRLLAAYGVAVPESTVIVGADEIERAFGVLKPPVVVKILSPDILHKSDVGGVKVNLKSVAEARDAVVAMMRSPSVADARIDGFLLEEMVPTGQEIVVGGLRDPQFGPLVMVGLGGVFVEVLADVSFRICPITTIDAREMLTELKGASILDGVRGAPPVSRDAIVDVLMKMGGESGLLMRHAADIQEADLNPVIVSAAGAVAVDARLILS